MFANMLQFNLYDQTINIEL